NLCWPIMPLNEYKDKLTVVLADDHAVTRAGLVPFVRELADRVDVLEAASLDEVLAHSTGGGRIDLVIVDLRMPGMNGVMGLRTVRKGFPGVPVVVFSGFSGLSDVRQAFECDINGFLPKTMGCDAIVSALKLVLAGEVYVPAVARPDVFGASGAAMPRRHPGVPALTPRERDILRLLCDGLSNKEIARSLGLQEITVKTHLRNVFPKLGVSNRSQALKAALQMGIAPVG
ncbi:MAG TPA: response regulator transcription factor, partial [Azospirillum sp.]